jgi:capsid protein
VVHGVLVDGMRRRREYWITKDDVDLSSVVERVSDITPYPARDDEGHRRVVHLYRPDRMTQTRGVTALAAPADTAGMGDDLMFAQLVKAQAASCFTILHEMAAGSMPVPRSQKGEATEETRPDGSTRRIEGVSPGMELFGFPGETLKGFSPNIPNPEFFEHASLILSFIGINLDLPLMILLLDPSKTNFSAWRGAMDQAKMRFRKFQWWLRDHYCRPIYEWKVRQWASRDPARRAAMERLGKAYFRCEWGLPNWPYIDPLKDASADLLVERNAQNSPRRIQAANGRDFWKVTDEIIDDNAYRIVEAKKRAAKINAEYPDDPVHWRELIGLPLAEGVNFSVVAGGDETAKNPEGGSDAKPQE